MEYCIISGFPSRELLSMDKGTLKIKIKQIMAPVETKERKRSRMSTCERAKPSYWLSSLRHKSYNVLDSNPSLIYCATLSPSLICLSCSSPFHIKKNKCKNDHKQTEKLSLVKWWVIWFYACLCHPARGSRHRGLWSHQRCSLPAVHGIQ